MSVEIPFDEKTCSLEYAQNWTVQYFFGFEVGNNLTCHLFFFGFGVGFFRRSVPADTEGEGCCGLHSR